MLLAIFASLAIYSTQEFHNIGEDLRTINEGHLGLARTVGQLETLEQNRFRDLRRASTEPDAQGREVILRIANAYFPDVLRARLEEVRDLCRQQVPNRGGAIAPGRIDAMSRGARPKFYAQILGHIERIAAEHEAVDELSDALLSRARARLGTADLEPEIDRLESNLRGELYQLNRTINDETDRAVRRAAEDERMAIWRVIAMTVFAILAGVTLTILSARALRPIKLLVGFSRAISRGDYSEIAIPRGDNELAELGLELELMAKNRKEREAELDRQQAELELAYHRVAELKRYHESIVQSLKTGVLVTDRDLNITSVNRAAEAMFGRPEAEIRGQPLASFPLGAELNRRLGALSELLSRQKELPVAALALGDRHLDLAITPFRNDLGQVLGIVLAVEDVTEGVRTKEALLRSERLAAIGRMSAHVTHEVRNPLASIGLNAELLEAMVKEGGMTGRSLDEAQALSRAIGREVDRLTAITEEYLRFARLPRPELAAEDIGELLESIGGFVRRDLELAHVSLTVSIPSKLPRALIDRDQIRQAILNLVRNGKESMPEGGTLRLSAEIEGERLVISVGDQGIGIKPENLDRIFDPFFSTKLTGTGLGLALCHQIVTEHGGQIRVRSELGQGSEFRIEVPLIQENPMSVEAGPRSAPLLLS